MAFDTSGFNFAAPQEQVYTPALANMAPLQMQGQGFVAPGMAASPFNIQAPSTAVAQGIAAAMGSLGKGIEVGFQSSQKAEEEKRKEALELKKLAATERRDASKEALADMRQRQSLGMQGAHLAIAQGTLDLARQKQEGKGAGVGFLDDLEVRKNINAKLPEIKQEKTLESTPQWNLYTSPQDGTPPEGKVDLAYPELSSTDVGTPSKSPIEVLRDITPDSIKLNYTQSIAGTDSFSNQADVPSAVTSMMAQAQALTPPTQGDFVPSQVDARPIGLLENLTAPSPASLPSAATSSEATSTIEVPSAGPYRSEKAAKQEAAKEYPGYEPKGTVKFDRMAGGYIVERPAMKQETLESMKMREESQKTREEGQKSTQQMRMDRLIGTARSAWEKSNEAVALTHPDKGKRPLMLKFMNDYKNSLENLTSQGIPQLGMLDAYARMESGGKVTEQQAQMALHANNVADKFSILFGGKVTGQILAESQVKQMRKAFLESYNSNANIANAKGEGFNNQLKAEPGFSKAVGFKPYVSGLIFREDFNDTKKELKENSKLNEENLKEAKSNGDEEGSKYYQEKIDKNKARATQLLRWLKASKEPVLGADDTENKVGQGFSGIGDTTQSIYGNR